MKNNDRRQSQKKQLLFDPMKNSSTKPKIQLLRQFKQQISNKYQCQQLDIDRILKTIQGQAYKYKNQKYNITEKQFITLCRMGRNVLLSQPSLLRIDGPIFVSTGTTGYYKDLCLIINRLGHPAFSNYLFIGDYTGRGDRGIQCLVLLMCLKIKYEDNFFMLRGCMDSIAMTRSYSLYDQCLQRLTPRAWCQACQFLCSLPFAAIVQNQVFCIHGGISPRLKYVQQIDRITRPIQTPSSGLVCDLIWSDLSIKQDSLDWSSSDRGIGCCFSQNTAQAFLKNNRLSMMIRGHDVIYNGFQLNQNKTIGTICSAINYGGLFSNSAAVFIINPQFQAYFKIIKQREMFPNQYYESNQSANSLLKKVIYEKRQQKKIKKQQQLQNLIKMEQNLRNQSQEYSQLKKTNKNRKSKKFKRLQKQNIRQQQIEEQIIQRQSGSSSNERGQLDQYDQYDRIKMKVMMGQAQIFVRQDIQNHQLSQDQQQVDYQQQNNQNIAVLNQQKFKSIYRNKNLKNQEDQYDQKL